MANSRQRIAQLALALMLPFALALSAAADEPGASPAGDKKPVRQVGGAQGPKPQVVPPSAPGELESPDIAARRAAVREKLRQETEIVRARLREARERLQQQALQSAKAGPPELVSNEASDDSSARAKRARINAWRGMMHRMQRPAEIPPEMRQELREHARRLARIQRIRKLARESKDEDALTRCSAVYARELARNRKHMSELWQAFMQQQAAAAQPPAAQAAARDEDEQDEPDPEEIEEEEAEDEEGAER